MSDGPSTLARSGQAQPAQVSSGGRRDEVGSCGFERGKDNIPSNLNHVIRTTSFPIEPGEDQETNPGVFGCALADYVTSQICSRGESVEEIIPEDFGSCIMLKQKPFRLWVGCGNRQERTDEWIAFAIAV
jgi:hypothetical protein